MESVQEKTVVALYDNFAEAQRVVQDLVDHGFQRNSISIIASDAEGEYADYLAQEEDDDDVSGLEGAGFGAVIGGLTGLLVGLGALAIPGIGPVLVAGPIAATLIGAGVGAVTGGLVGALVDLGVPENEAGYYAEGVRRGGTLVTIHVPGHMSDRAVDIMDHHDPVDIEERVSTWEERGWAGFNPEAEPYDEPKTETRDWVVSDAISRPAYTPPALEREGIYYDDDEFNVFEEDFRRHYDTTYTSTGYPYDRYLPAYRYGYSLALDERYDDWDWDQIEPEVRSYWEANEKGAWEEVKDAIRYGWEEVKDALGVEDDYDDFETFEEDFRRHYDTTYTSTGYPYDQYLPAYRFGYDLALDEQYENWDWDQIEPEARSYWEANEKGAWEDFKDAVRHSWEEVKDALVLDDDYDDDLRQTL